MLFAGNSAAGQSAGRLIDLVKLLSALWLAGVAMRMTLLAVPPVIPLVHQDLHMSETQVGLLVGLPLSIFAIAAIPGSLLIARTGPWLAVVIGMVIAALAGGARGAAFDVGTLYAATIAMGFGVAIMQPGLPTLVREWLPARIALGTLAYTGGMLLGSIFPPLLTDWALTWLGGSWRLNFIAWAVPAFLIAPAFALLTPRPKAASAAAKPPSRLWWPDFKSPVVWLLGLTLGGNNSPYFATTGFLGDYLADKGKAELLGASLTSLNGAQVVALVVMLFLAGRLQQRAWPFLIFGPILLLSFIAMMVIKSTIAIIVTCAVIGFATAMTFPPLLALVPALCTAQDVSRTAAGMFTIAYACAIVFPTICGAIWDATGRPWTAFVPLCLCAVVLTVLGAMVARRRPAGPIFAPA